jgi:hypothetical protein
MSLGHVNGELHQLLVGDLPNNEMLVVTDHLRDCEACRQELVDVSLAHALLTSVSELLAPEFHDASNTRGADHRDPDLPPLACFERDFVTDLPDASLAPAPSRPSRGFENATWRSDRPSVVGVPGGPRLPIVAAVGSDAACSAMASSRRHRRRPGTSRRPQVMQRARRAMYRSGLVAVAVAILVFAAIIGVGSLRHPQPNRGQIVLTASLEPLRAAPDATGTVVVRADGDVSVATSGLTAAPSGHYYEVWLVDPGTPRMLPLGILPSKGAGKFSFPASLWRDYAGVAIRLQTTGAWASSSGTSMLSTVRPAHHQRTHRPAPRVPPRASHPKVHPSKPVTRKHPPKTHHPKNHHPKAPNPKAPNPKAPHPKAPPKLHQAPPVAGFGDPTAPVAVRSLLASTERQLSAGQGLSVDTTRDADAVDPASGLCRDSLGSCSLRAAIEVADALGTPVTIHVPAGNYVLTLGALVATDPAGVSIDGASPAATTITSAGQADRVLVVQRAGTGSASSAGAVVSLADVTLRGGTAPSTQAWAGEGGAILVADTSDLLEMTRVTIADSSAATAGGGLYARGRVWATAAKFEDDSAGASGGAAQFEQSMALITNSVFTGDSAGASGVDGGRGGAVDDAGAALVLVYSSFIDDSVTAIRSDARGGAMAIRGPAWLASDVFAGDHAAAAPSPEGPVMEEGGALYVRSGPVTIETGTFENDVAYGAKPFGGAIFNRAVLSVNVSQFLRNAVMASPGSVDGEGGAIDNLGVLTVTGSSFLENTSTDDGGALDNGGKATVLESEFLRNRARDSGGAIYEHGSLTLAASTVAHGVALLGGGIFVKGSFESRGVAVVDNLATGAGAAGGGLLIVDHVSSTRHDKVKLRRTTITGNVAPVGAGIAELAGTGLRVLGTVSRSVISANDLPTGVEQNCAAIAPQAAFSLVSGGQNAVGDETCGLAALTDREGPAAQSFWFATADGAVRAFASVVFGSLAGKRLEAPVVAIAASPGGEGYWEVTADGRVANFGSAPWYGSPQGRLGDARVTGFAVTLDGGGYWIVTSVGQVFNFGDAVNYGSAATAADIVGIARSVDGRGYWLLGANGDVHAFGDAPRIASRTGLDAAAIATTPDGQGYWIATSGGAVYSFGDATSYGGTVTSGVVALLPSLDGRGYLLVNDHGQVFAHGDASFTGRMRAVPIAAAAT